MRFILGVAVGTAVGPRFYKWVDKHYGDILVPHLQNLLKKVESWEPPTEGKR